MLYFLECGDNEKERRLLDVGGGMSQIYAGSTS